MAENFTQIVDLTNVLKLKDIVAYQEHSVVSREIIRKPSGTMTVFAFDKGEGLSEHTAVKVEAILDKSQRNEKYTSATFLANVGVPTFIDDKHAIAHNKVMIIDRSTVITGSFNFTKAAEEKNAENLLIIKSKELANLYIDSWMKHREHSEPFQARY
jgi:phosphatidylserine/phosphatidylglycerophosphate/cardiolipin synthase-like enzyme